MGRLQFRLGNLPRCPGKTRWKGGKKSGRKDKQCGNKRTKPKELTTGQGEEGGARREARRLNREKMKRKKETVAREKPRQTPMYHCTKKMILNPQNDSTGAEGKERDQEVLSPTEAVSWCGLQFSPVRTRLEQR